MKLAKGWSRESEDLFLHDTGARISRSAYRGKMAWWYFPVSLDVPAVEHAPTDEGRDLAFATSERDLPRAKSKPKSKSGAGNKAAASTAKDEDDREPDKDSAESTSNAEEAGDEDNDESGE